MNELRTVVWQFGSNTTTHLTHWTPQAAFLLFSSYASAGVIRSAAGKHRRRTNGLTAMKGNTSLFTSLTLIGMVEFIKT